MKVSFIILLALILVVSVFAQDQPMEKKFTRYTTLTNTNFKADTLSLGASLAWKWGWVANDAITGNDTLWVAFGNDTTATNITPILKGESVYYRSIGIKFIRMKVSGGSIPVRAEFLSN